MVGGLGAVRMADRGIALERVELPDRMRSTIAMRTRATRTPAVICPTQLRRRRQPLSELRQPKPDERGEHAGDAIQRAA